MTIRDLVEQAYRKEIRTQLEAVNANDDEIQSILRGFDEAATFHLDQRVGDDSLTIEETIANYLVDERDAYQQLQLSREVAMTSFAVASAQAIRILRDKQTGIVDEFAWSTLKHAQEYLIREERRYCSQCGRPTSEPHCGFGESWQ